jgi:hypothetical protein
MARKRKMTRTIPTTPVTTTPAVEMLKSRRDKNPACIIFLIVCGFAD